jgi:hypothetical protein
MFFRFILQLSTRIDSQQLPFCLLGNSIGVRSGNCSFVALCFALRGAIEYGEYCVSCLVGTVAILPFDFMFDFRLENNGNW